MSLKKNILGEVLGLGDHNCNKISRLPITRTLANSNQIRFPLVCYTAVFSVVT